MEQQEQKPWLGMTQRTRIGVWVTALYLLFIGLMYYWSEQSLATMDLNSIGDYFAGVFGPLAFAWLVLGYLQQGDELRLQAKELSQAVDQARELVAATRQQAQEEQTRHDKEIERQNASAQPYLRVFGSVFDGQTSRSGWKLTVSNTGATCADITIAFEDPMGVFAIDRIDRLETSGKDEIYAYFTEDRLSGFCSLHFRDALGQQQKVRFAFYEMKFLGGTPSLHFNPSSEEPQASAG